MSLEDNRQSQLCKPTAQYVSGAEVLKAATKTEVLIVTSLYVNVGFLEQRKIKTNSVGHGYGKIFGKCSDDK
ncbi:hypothetical protein KIN20_018511 [Parelaphostrongylus tenuis]|uniref:Uncharacterized protein n=1 Tax=Parelaphostrongylus tenuis TaxID=148309 RepID=A0AAD5QS62_PARTN|nr:hypothetical protein KIN20_018511 [Parelaphostrongylus tenuis]